MGLIQAIGDSITEYGIISIKRAPRFNRSLDPSIFRILSLSTHP